MFMITLVAFGKLKIKKMKIIKWNALERREELIVWFQ